MNISKSGFLKRDLLLKIWQITLYGFLIFWSYHLIRDILQDLFNFHHPFIDVFHPAQSPKDWCFPYCKWVTFPVEIFFIVSSVYLIKKKKFGFLGVIQLALLLIMILQRFHLF